MKKLLLLIFTLFASVSLTYTQDYLFTRAFQFNLGYKEAKNSPIVWSSHTNVDLLISFQENTVKVYSSEIQEYRTISDPKVYSQYNKYLAIDKSGKKCTIYIGVNDDIFLMIEYSDYAFLYYLTPND